MPVFRDEQWKRQRHNSFVLSIICLHNSTPWKDTPKILSGNNKPQFQHATSFTGKILRKTMTSWNTTPDFDTQLELLARLTQIYLWR